MTQSLLLQRQTTGRVQAAQGDVNGCSQDDVSRKAAIRLQAAARAKLVRKFCCSFFPVDIDRVFADQRVADAPRYLDYQRCVWHWDPGTNGEWTSRVALGLPLIDGALLEAKCEAGLGPRKVRYADGGAGWR